MKQPIRGCPRRPAAAIIAGKTSARTSLGTPRRCGSSLHTALRQIGYRSKIPDHWLACRSRTLAYSGLTAQDVLELAKIAQRSARYSPNGLLDHWLKHGIWRDVLAEANMAQAAASRRKEPTSAEPIHVAEIMRPTRTATDERLDQAVARSQAPPPPRRPASDFPDLVAAWLANPARQTIALAILREYRSGASPVTIASQFAITEPDVHAAVVAGLRIANGRVQETA